MAKNKPEDDSVNVPKAYILLAIASLLLFTTKYVPQLNEFLYRDLISFLHDIGASGLVAFFLILTVEQVSRRRMQKESAGREKQRESEIKHATEEIKSNLFKAIYHRHVPEELFAQIERVMFTEPVYRSDYTVNYHIRKFGKTEGFTKESVYGHVECIVSSDFTLHNTSNEPIVYIAKTHLELPQKKELNPLVFMKSYRVGSVIIEDERIAEYVKDDPDGMHYMFEYPVELLPNETKRISMCSSLIRASTDQEVWASRVPSSGMKLNITHPEGMSVKATANHLDALSCMPEYIPNQKSWELSSAIFPFQSVIFWWTMDNNE